MDETIIWIEKNPRVSQNVVRMRKYLGNKFFDWFSKLLKVISKFSKHLFKIINRMNNHQNYQKK